jgi:uncharacterized membrane protein YfcA
MPPISFKAIAIAFCAEVAADLLNNALLLAFFARGMLAPEMSEADILKMQKTVLETTDFLPWAAVCGMATTIGGAYLAARIAKRIPYYHGLAMGVVGVLFSLLFWRTDATWLDWLALVLTIPASLYGAQLAKRHMTVAP